MLISVRKIIILIIVIICIGWEFTLADESKYQGFIKAVSDKIIKLKESYPQLKEFSMDMHVDPENLRIEYSYHTHQSEHRAGWTSGVPNPDPDGIWFYIDLHEKNSTAQIHTQPVTGISFEFSGKDICFLILEGSETKSIYSEIILIFEQIGASAKSEMP